MLPALSYWDAPWSSKTSFTTGTGSTTAVVLTEMYVAAAITISQISFQVITPASNSGIGFVGFWGIGLYDTDGNLVVDSGPVEDLDIPFKVYTANITPVTIGSGLYWLALTVNNASASVTSIGEASEAIDLMNRPVPQMLAGAANTSVNGQLPATTGVISDISLPGGSPTVAVKFN